MGEVRFPRKNGRIDITTDELSSQRVASISTRFTIKQAASSSSVNWVRKKERRRIVMARYSPSPLQYRINCFSGRRDRDGVSVKQI